MTSSDATTTRATWPWSDEQWTGLFDFYNIPHHLRAGLRRYLSEAIRPGGFLCAVLEGNLFQAVLRQDRDDVDALRRLVTFLQHEAPSGSFGSPDAVTKWVEQNKAWIPPMPNDYSRVQSRGTGDR